MRGQSFLGKKHTEETKQKIREANLGKPSPFKGKKRNKPAWNKGIKMWEGKEHPRGMLGKKATQQTLEKLKTAWESHKSLPPTRYGKDNHLFGKDMKGPNNPRWIYDRSKLVEKQQRNDSAYKEWRRQVWLRDNFKCKIANPDCLGRIEAHHILIWKDYPELRYKINNGITLCHAHHPRKRSEEKRLETYFMELVSVSSEK